MLGLDIHPEYQRGIRLDLAKSAQGVGFVWIKTTDGPRPYVSANGYTPKAMAGDAHQAQLPAGGYCYAQPGDGAGHADVLLNQCIRWGLTGLYPAIDIEDDARIHVWSTAEATSYGRAFCARIRAHGLRPVVYMNASKMQACRPDLWPENPVIWVARYPGPPDAPGGARYTGRWDVHQYSSGGTVPGSAGLVDLNRSSTTAHFATDQGVDDMALAPDERYALVQILGQMGGQLNGAWPGWDKLDPAEFQRATLVDFVRRTYAEVRRTQVQLAALAQAVAAATNSPDITVEQLTAIVNAAVAEHIEITGTVEIGAKPHDATP